MRLIVFINVPFLVGKLFDENAGLAKFSAGIKLNLQSVQLLLAELTSASAIAVQQLIPSPPQDAVTPPSNAMKPPRLGDRTDPTPSSHSKRFACS